ncbi:MAG: DNA repair protein RecN [Lachnospiraceae bacterium]|nr:DNA repair protein RecN [Lachnospiraceae bacterium]
MLVSLNVKNLALIEQAEVDLTEGLNILSGETGAGKSIIIGSVTLALGAKADADLIRSGADAASIELIFQTADAQVQAKMEELDLPWEADGTIVIARKIQPNRSVFKVNGETVTARIVRQLSELLLDIHGQHDHQSLLKPEKHREILDAYAGDEMAQTAVLIKETYRKLQELTEELSAGSLDEAGRLREMELLQYEIDEIEQAAVKEGEDEALESDYQKMVNSRRIMEAIGIAQQLTEGDVAIGSMIDRALRELRGVMQYDPAIEELEHQLEDIDSLIGDFGHGCNAFASQMEFDDETFRETEDRLNTLNHLKSKYGGSLSAVLSYQEEKTKELEKLTDYETYRADLEKEAAKVREELVTACRKASALRTGAAKDLSAKLKAALVDLNFLHVEFEIAVTPEEEKITSHGFDHVEFMISTNPGEALRPLIQVASGGELSRIMLALKTVLADRDAIETLIFDEIDTGISGQTAWKVSEKLGTLSRAHQVICITHLPQIAAMADTHFFIEKRIEQASTRTSIDLIEGDARIREIARMVGGDEISSAAMENAKELIASAQKHKMC